MLKGISLGGDKSFYDKEDNIYTNFNEHNQLVTDFETLLYKINNRHQFTYVFAFLSLCNNFICGSLYSYYRNFYL